jgi:hypothetical protein
MEYGLLRRLFGTRMLDREKIVAVLKRRFPASTPGEIAAAANALVGLEDEWMELSLIRNGEGQCGDGCYLQQVLQDREIRMFSRRRDREV